ncbi:MAG: hypothetical protein ACQESX_04415 [Bacteroidota bacterium]
MIKNRLLLTGIILLLSIVSLAQNKEQNDNRAGSFFVGGNLGLQFGTVTLIDVSPMAGYYFTNNWSAGIGATYKYYRYTLLDSKFVSSYYGGRAFTRYQLQSKNIDLLNYLFLHGEYELLNYRFEPQGGGNEYENTKVESYFIGGGYNAPLSNKVNAHILLLYNLNDTANSPYDNPVVRVGVSVRL